MKLLFKILRNKLLLLFIKAAFPVALFAPGSHAITMVEGKESNPFSDLIYAIGKVETNLDTLAYNPTEEATGFFQIRPVRVEDYNRRTGNSFTLSDMYDYSKSEKVFLYYASEIGPYNFERIARRWNGSGSKTYNYWKRVKRYLPESS
jgi:hypothetical protein